MFVPLAIFRAFQRGIYSVFNSFTIFRRKQLVSFSISEESTRDYFHVSMLSRETFEIHSSPLLFFYRKHNRFCFPHYLQKKVRKYKHRQSNTWYIRDIILPLRRLPDICDQLVGPTVVCLLGQFIRPINRALLSTEARESKKLRDII